MPTSTDLSWDDATWNDINDAVVKEINKIRTAQKVFPTTAFETDPTEVQNEVIDIKNFTIEEGLTKPYVEAYQEFSLSSAQISKEADLKTCKTLSRMVAKQLALGEDVFLFQGLAEMLKVVKGDPKTLSHKSLLDLAATTIPVEQRGGKKAGVIYGENVFSAVANGIAELTKLGQAPTYALFLPTGAFADTYVPPSDASLVTTAERIKPLVEGGYYGTGTLPDKSGLLVALGGDPTSIYVGREAKTEYLRKDGSRYFFRVVERIQFVARDARALVKLEFK